MQKTILYKDAFRASQLNEFQVMVKPTGPACNLNCTYCYYIEKKKLYPENHEFRMSEEVLTEFIKQYISANKASVVNFTWQGGEPTLMGIDFFKKAIKLQNEYAGGRKIENSFQTNGTRLNEEWCRFFHDNNILVGISIDGAEHNHDHFRKNISGRPTFSHVMKGIELLKKYKVEFNTLSCVNSYNVNYASETYKFLKSIGSKFMQFLPVVERNDLCGNGDGLTLVSNEFNGECKVTYWSVNGKDYGKFLITIFDLWVREDVGRYFVPIFDSTLANWVGEIPGICVFAETCGDAFVIEHNGDVYSCDHYVYPEFFLGNIMKKPLSDITRLQSQFDFGIKKRNSLPVQCLKCDIRFACNGECPKHRISFTADGQPGLNWLCEGYKMFYKHSEASFMYMAKELEANRAPSNVMKWIKNRESQVKKPVIPGRNDNCPCGSGMKFKNCCALKPPYSLIG
jgi:uncharacterized protein